MRMLLLCFLAFVLGNGEISAADYFWVNGSGNWTDFNGHWSTTSGGTTMHTSSPSDADDVFFDANSFSAIGAIVNFNTGIEVQSLDFSTATFQPTFTGSNDVEVLKDLSFSALCTYSNTGSWIFSGDINTNIFANGAVINSPITIQKTNELDTVSISGVLNSSSFIEIERGSFILFNSTLNINSFVYSSFFDSWLVLNNSDVHLIGSGLVWEEQSTFLNVVSIMGSVNLDHSTDAIVDVMADTIPGLLKVNCANVNFIGASYFDTLAVVPGGHIQINDTISKEVAYLNAVGTCGLPIKFSGINADGRMKINSYLVDHLRINSVDNYGTMVSSFNSILEGASFGWDFDLPQDTSTFYWIGGSGNWSDTNHWSNVSGGPAIVGCIPGPFNNVVVDNNSGLVGSTIFIDEYAYCKNFESNVTAVGSVLDGDPNSVLNLYGDLRIANNLGAPFTGDFVFYGGDSTEIFAPNTVFHSNFVLNPSDTTQVVRSLQSTVRLQGDIQLIGGYFESNNFNVWCNNLISIGNRERVLNLGSSIVNLNNYANNNGVNRASGFQCLGDSISLNVSNSVINIQPSGNRYVNFTGNENEFGTLNLNGIDVLFNDSNHFELIDVSSGNVVNIYSDITLSMDSIATTSSCDSVLFIQSYPNSGIPARMAVDSMDSIHISFSVITNVNAVLDTSTQVFEIGSGALLNSTDNWVNLNVSTSGSTYYWRGGTGIWSDLTKWSSSAVGITPVTCLPSTMDTVVFDAVSFSAPNQTVSISDEVIVSAMISNLVDENCIFNLQANLRVLQLIQLAPLVTMNGLSSESKLVGAPEDTLLFDLFSASINADIVFVAQNDTGIINVTSNIIQENGDGITILNGGLNFLADTVISNGIHIQDSLPKTIDLQDVILELDNYWKVDDFPANQITQSGSFINVLGDTTKDYDCFFGNDAGYGTVKFSNSNRNLRVSGDNTFQNLIIERALNVFLEPATVNTISDSLIINGECDSFVNITVDTNYVILSSPIAFLNGNSAKTEIKYVVIQGVSSNGLTAYYSDTSFFSQNWIVPITQGINADFTSDTVVCLGDTVLFNNTSQLGPFLSTAGYYWSFDDNSYDTAVNSSNVYSNPGIYNVELLAILDPSKYSNQQKLDLNFNGNCYSKSFQLIEVVEVFDEILFDVSTNTICDGDEVQFTNSYFNDSINFILDGVSQTGWDTSGHSWTTNTLVNGSETYLQVQKSGCVVNTDTIIWTVDTIPTVSFIQDFPDTLCTGSQIDVEVSKGYTYKFLSNGNDVSGADTTGMFSYIGAQQGDSLGLQVIDTVSGCVNFYFADSLMEINYPVVGLSLVNQPVAVICNYDTLVVASNGATEYEFFINSNGFGASSLDTMSYSGLSNGDTIYSIGDSLGCKSTSNYYVVTVNQEPVISVSYNDSDLVICDQTPLLCTPSGAWNYNFYLNDTLLTNDFDYNYAQLKDGDVVGVIGFDYCASAIHYDTVQVDTLPIVGLICNDLDTVICQGDTVLFTASGAAMYQLVLNGIPQDSFTTNNQFIVDSIGNQFQYSVIGSSNNCESMSSDVFTFDVKALPTIQFSTNDTSKCEGESIGINLFGAQQYDLYVNGTLFDTSIVSNFYNVSGLSPGLNDLSIVGETGECPNDADTVITVNVKANPTLSLVSSDTNFCSNDTVLFTVGGAVDYVFYVDNTPQGPTDTIQTWSSSNLNSGQNVWALGTQNGCTNSSDSIMVTVTQNPILSLVSSDPNNTICENDTISFFAYGAGSYEFFFDNISLGKGIDSVVTFDTLSTPHLISVIGFNGTCTTTATMSSVTVVNPLPVISMTTTDLDSTICSDSLIQIAASGSGLYQLIQNNQAIGGMTLTNQWSIGNVTNGDIFKVKGVSANGCEAESADSIIVTVVQKPTISISQNIFGEDICGGDTVVISSSGGDTYQFFNNGNNLGGFSNVDSIVLSNLNNGDSIYVVGQKDGCFAKSDTSLGFAVYQYPVVSLNTITSISNPCFGDTLTFVASGALEYELQLNGVTSSIKDTLNTFVLNNLIGSNTVSVIGYNNICATPSDTTFSIFVDTIPIVSYQSQPASNVLCYGDSVQLNLAGAKAYEIFWNGLSHAQISSPSSIKLGGMEPTDSLVLFGYNGGCESSPQPINFQIQKIPLDVSFSSRFLCENEPLSLATSGANQYRVWRNAGILGSFSATSNYTVNTINNGDTIYVEGQSTATGCIQKSQGTIISVYQEPNISPLGPIISCDGVPVVLESNSNGDLFWYNNGVIQDSLVSEISADTSGMYSVNLHVGGIDVIKTVGSNGYGQLGDDKLLPKVVPEQITVPGGAALIAAGEHHAVALSLTGEVYAWGSNTKGQLGSGNFSNSNKPQLVGGVDSIQSIACGKDFTILLDSTGNVYAFGNNSSGQLGLGVFGVVNFAAKNTNLSGIKEVVAGTDYFMALDATGNVWAMGNNVSGQLGNGTTANSNIPVLITTLPSVSEIKAGGQHAAAIGLNGDVYLWGNNSQGQLGFGGVAFMSVPTKLDKAFKIVSASLGQDHSLFLDINFVLLTAGSNYYGQLGQNNSSSNLTRLSNHKFEKVIAGHFNSIGKRSDGSYLVWGANHSNQFGVLDSIIHTPTLARVFDGANFVSTGFDFSTMLMDEMQQCSSQMVSVTIDTNLNPMVIQVSPTELISSVNGISYQWYFNGNPLPGEINKNYFPYLTGYYMVEVTSVNGCKYLSPEFNWWSLGQEELQSVRLKCYPNPADNELKVQSNVPIRKVSLTDISGRLLFVQEYGSNKQIALSVSEFSAGVYFVHVETTHSKQVYTNKIVVK